MGIMLQIKENDNFLITLFREMHGLFLYLLESEPHNWTCDSSIEYNGSDF